MTAPTRLEAWKALQAHYQEVAPLHLRDLFRRDPPLRGAPKVPALRPALLAGRRQRHGQDQRQGGRASAGGSIAP